MVRLNNGVVRIPGGRRKAKESYGDSTEVGEEISGWVPNPHIVKTTSSPTTDMKRNFSGGSFQHSVSRRGRRASKKHKRRR